MQPFSRFGSRVLGAFTPETSTIQFATRLVPWRCQVYSVDRSRRRCGMFGVALLQSICLHQYFHRIYKTGMRIRSGIMTVCLLCWQIFIDTLSVPQLKHYAEDAGKSKEEISKITNPEI